MRLRGERWSLSKWNEVTVLNSIEEPRAVGYCFPFMVEVTKASPYDLLLLFLALKKFDVDPDW